MASWTVVRIAKAATILLAATCNAGELMPKLAPRATPTCSLGTVSPTPAGTICNQTGSVRTGSILSFVNTTDLTTCRYNCIANDANCKTFSFGPGSSCTTYSIKPQNMEFRADTGTQKFWNRACFTRTCGLCPAGQTNCGGQCVTTSTDSNNCATCGNVCASPLTCQSSACLCPSGTALAGRAACVGSCNIDYSTDSSNCGSCGSTCSSTQICSNGTCVAKPPLLINGDFGTGTLSPWTKTIYDSPNFGGNLIIDGPGYGDNMAAHFTAQNSPDNYYGAAIYLEQRLSSTLTQGVAYTLSFYYLQHSNSTGTGTFNIYLQSKSGGYLVLETIQLPLASQDTWQLFSAPFTGDGGQPYFDLMLQSNAHSYINARADLFSIS